MRRLIAVVALLALIVAAPGCRRKKKGRAAPPPDDGRLASVVQVADPRSTVQLLKGFHAIENDAWRWTEKSFAVSLRVPDGAAQKKTVLEVKLTIPQVIIDNLRSVTLSASIGGVALPP